MKKFAFNAVLFFLVSVAWSAEEAPRVIVQHQAVSKKSNRIAKRIKTLVEKNSVSVLTKLLIKDLDTTFPLLLECCPTGMLKDKVGRTLLHCACQFESLSLVKRLVALNPKLMLEKTQKNVYPFHVACSTKNRDIVRFLAQQDPTVLDLISEDGSTVLHFAASHGTLETIEFILNNRPGLIAVDNKRGHNPFQVALVNGNVDAAKFFINQEPSFKAALKELEFHAFMHAVDHQNLPMIQFLVEQTPHLAMHEHNNTCLFFLACRYAPREIVEYLCKKNPKLLSLRDKLGGSALHVACSAGNRAVAHYLIEQDSNLLETVDNQNGTPLHWCALMGQSECGELLLTHKPDLIEKLTTSGETALHCACTNAHKKVALMLMQKSDTLIRKNSVGKPTALHYAVRAGDAELFELILQLHLSPDFISFLNENKYQFMLPAHAEKRAKMRHVFVAYGLAELPDASAVERELKKKTKELFKEKDFLALRSLALQEKVPLLTKYYTPHMVYTLFAGWLRNRLAAIAQQSATTQAESMKQLELDALENAKAIAVQMNLSLVTDVVTGESLVHLAIANNFRNLVVYLLRTNPKLIAGTDTQTIVEYALAKNRFDIIEDLTKIARGS